MSVALKIVPELLMTVFDQGRMEKFIKRIVKNEKAKAFVKAFDYVTMGVRCRTCDVVLPIYEYRQGKSGAKGIHFGECSKCKRSANCPHAVLLSHAKARVKVNNKNGRKFDEVDFDVDFLKKKLEEQGGLCYYSDLPMSIKHSDGDGMNMSLERLRNYISYIKSNVVLICAFLQFGGGHDMQREGTRAILFYDPTLETEANRSNEKFIKEANDPNGGSKAPEVQYDLSPIRDDNGKVTSKCCIDCGVYHDPGEFNKGKLFCKGCQGERDKVYRNTVKGYIDYICRNAIGSSKRRASKKRKRGDEDARSEVPSNIRALVIDIIASQNCRDNDRH